MLSTVFQILARPAYLEAWMDADFEAHLVDAAQQFLFQHQPWTHEAHL
jgi:hypothetical protein